MKIANGLSGLLFVALGLLVLRVRVRARANRAFALFAVSFGAVMLTLNLAVQVGHAPPLLLVAEIVAYLVAVGGLVWLAHVYPSPSARPSRSGLALAGLLLAAAGILFADAIAGAPDALTVLSLIEQSCYFLLAGAFVYALAAFAGRFPRASAKDASALALVSAALLLYPSFLAGTLVTQAARGGVVYAVLTLILATAILAIVLLWLRNVATADAHGRALARAVVLLGCAAALAGLWQRSASGDAGDLWGFGLSRVAGVAVLGYAILRHQLLGLDVRVRWAISRSTLGAAFIAAFFVVSALGQRYLEGSLGPYLGVAAAGALVFALAPLQRLADRLATVAVPLGAGGAAAPGATVDERAERIYRRAVLAAIEDGKLTRAEEEHLAHIAHELGLSHLDALRLRREESEHNAEAPSDPGAGQ